ncbi:MAG: hypothetical protein ACXIUL_07010 [Wenzhouxiangella sp.]
MKTSIGKSGTGIGKSGTGIGKSGTGIDALALIAPRRKSMTIACGLVLGLCAATSGLADDSHSLAWSASGDRAVLSLHVGDEWVLGRVGLDATTDGFASFELFGVDVNGIVSHGSGTGTASHGSGTGQRSHGSGTGTTSHGSGTGQRSHGSGTGTTSHGSGTGQRSHGSGTGTTSHGSGTGQRSHGSGTGTTSHGSGTGQRSHGSGTGTTGHQPVVVAWGYAEMAFDGADIHLVAYRYEGGAKVEAFVAVLEEGKGWELIPSR